MSTILTVLKYDFRRFLRDWLMVVFSVAMMILYVVVILFVPVDIAPNWNIAVTEASAPAFEKVLKRDLGEEGNITLKVFPNEEALRKVFEDNGDAESADDDDGEYFVGIAIDDDAQQKLARGERPKARVYVDESATPEVQETARAIGAMLAMAPFFPESEGQDKPEELGPKIDQTNFKDRMKGLMAIMILVMELLAFGSLMSREISSGVVHAILTTTVSLPRYFAAKMAFGVTLAFVQSAGLAALAGVVSAAPVVILLQLFFGAILFTAAGMIAGTRGRHLMEVIMWAMVFMLPALVPAFAIMLPGTPPLIVQAMPSYPLIHGVISAGQEAPLYSPWLLVGWTAAWALGLTAISYVALRRRVK